MNALSPLRRSRARIVWALGIGSLAVSVVQSGLVRIPSPTERGERRVIAPSTDEGMNPQAVRRLYETMTDAPRRLVEAEARARSGN